MKRLFFLLLVIPLISCENKKPQIDQVEWLVGQWKRVNDNNDFQSYEFWKKSSPTSLKGIGFSLKGTDTTFVERLTLEVRDGKLIYVADTRQNDAPVDFELTSVTPRSFVSENPEHDFPKMIAYELQGLQMVATISDGSNQKVNFIFERMR